MACIVLVHTAMACLVMAKILVSQAEVWPMKGHVVVNQIEHGAGAICHCKHFRALMQAVGVWAILVIMP